MHGELEDVVGATGGPWLHVAISWDARRNNLLARSMQRGGGRAERLKWRSPSPPTSRSSKACNRAPRSSSPWPPSVGCSIDSWSARWCRGIRPPRCGDRLAVLAVVSDPAGVPGKRVRSRTRWPLTVGDVVERCVGEVERGEEMPQLGSTCCCPPIRPKGTRAGKRDRRCRRRGRWRKHRTT